MTTTNFQHNLMNMQSNLYNFALMLTSDSENAYCLVQDTTLKALDSQDTFTDDANFRGWLYKLMRNIFVSNYRRIAAEAAKIDTSEGLYSINLAADQGLEKPAGTVYVNEMTASINTLGADVKTTFSLYMKGYTVAEIAERQHLNLKDVKAAIVEARKTINHAS